MRPNPGTNLFLSLLVLPTEGFNPSTNLFSSLLVLPTEAGSALITIRNITIGDCLRVHKVLPEHQDKSRKDPERELHSHEVEKWSVLLVSV